jgi:elongation factor P
VISTNRPENGNHIEVNRTVYRLLRFDHMNPGKGASFVERSPAVASDGAASENSFRASETLRSGRVEMGRMQFFSVDGEAAHFLDIERNEQISVPAAASADALKWNKFNDDLEILIIDDKLSDLHVLSAVDLEATQTNPGFRSDVAYAEGRKPTAQETDVVVQVPLFISAGETIGVDTRDGKDPSRA